VRKNLRFNTPEGSVNSSSLGIPSANGRASRKNSVALAPEVPTAVDAFDGFDEGERRTEDAVEAALAKTVDSMSLKLNQVETARMNEAGRGGIGVTMPGAPNSMQGSGSGKVEMMLTQEALKFMKETSAHDTGSQGKHSGPHSSDMIPPLRGLSQLEMSQGSGSDVSMTAADTVLGKRMAGESVAPERRLDLSLALNYTDPLGGKPKRGRKAGTGDGQGDKKDGVLDSVAARTRRKIVTGSSTSGNLTRPKGGSRQEK
jgi:hypothetical protein